MPRRASTGGEHISSPHPCRAGSWSTPSTWRGSILATERRSGIFLGANSYTEGGIYGQRILAKGPKTTVQHFPWKGKLVGVP